MADQLIELEKKLEALKVKFSGTDWKNNLDGISREFRRLGSEYAQQGVIKGFVLDLNGVDASHARTRWPHLSFESNELVVKMSILHEGKPGHIVLSISDEPDEIPTPGKHLESAPE